MKVNTEITLATNVKVWRLKISKDQMKAIMAVTDGLMNFIPVWMCRPKSEKKAKEESLARIFEAAKAGKIRIEFAYRNDQTSKIPHNDNGTIGMTCFYFDTSFKTSGGHLITEKMFLQFGSNSIIIWDNNARIKQGFDPLPAGIPQLDAKTKWEWLKELLNLF